MTIATTVLNGMTKKAISCAMCLIAAEVTVADVTIRNLNIREREKKMEFSR
jgi:hypothetical protein